MGHRLCEFFYDNRHGQINFQNVEAIPLSDNVLSKHLFTNHLYRHRCSLISCQSDERKNVIFVILFCMYLTANEEKHFADVPWPLAASLL